MRPTTCFTSKSMGTYTKLCKNNLQIVMQSVICTRDFISGVHLEIRVKL